jgi:hypothetical protein
VTRLGRPPARAGLTLALLLGLSAAASATELWGGPLSPEDGPLAAAGAFLRCEIVNLGDNPIDVTMEIFDRDGKTLSGPIAVPPSGPARRPTSPSSPTSTPTVSPGRASSPGASRRTGSVPRRRSSFQKKTAPSPRSRRTEPSLQKRRDGEEKNRRLRGSAPAAPNLAGAYPLPAGQPRARRVGTLRTRTRPRSLLTSSPWV